MQLTTELSISGMPVVDDGKLMGIVTRRDFRYADNLTELVSSIMTPHEKLITVEEGFNQDEVKKLMYNNRIEKILVTLQILSVGTQAKVIIKVSKKLTQDLCILLIMKDMEDLKKSLIVKSNG